ncbi:aminotransferase class I/II-fold pyridoxal phosphate-dependent enzyme [Heyndrickxia sporothermodurans]|nr:aminotransferase class I/II-fold pyridoxal phosphate-dependent enzyme [Heyndrickxia sporothermodurans]MBL5768904.1 aminotransferase class I/II-fold pyridoxal phosphate-dependent enzyme [Heyndrickxia sporothermodurans]MBL5772667.1 aminotransferase class I/II-fold pyridoxal phosphate-dependent enzyme [Heyndrickxia sporothermodurans]MBL5776162.1 aminotransferase class I/II-fold pyridoxal phosphate-dependent enzyme [Heyndrickxia sporothermodurans]MBL5779700.1 aminotransferase class I/II-fold pyr
MNQNRIPIYEALEKFLKNDPISFHVPGHKNGMLLKNEYPDLSRFLTYDVTELSGLDDLHSPDGPILEAQKLLSDYYGTRRSYFLVNGSTVGNLIMILSAFNAGDKVLVQRNCHKSIMNALVLAKVIPIFIEPRIDENMFVPEGVRKSIIKAAYNQYADVKGLVVTHPNYYGMTSYLEDIINIVHQHKGVVLVDEAHGPHFHLGEPFPKSAIDLGADMVVHSAHKMLPAMTMGSYLHINSNAISISKVEYYYSVLQSSSPSYPIMATLDIARHFIANFNEEDINYTLSQRNSFVTSLCKLEGVEVVNRNMKQDPLKLIVRYKGYSGYMLQRMLEEENIYIEMADPYQVVFILPLLKKNMVYSYSDALIKIKRVFEKYKPKSNSLKGIVVESDDKISSLSLLYEEMEDRSIEWVPFRYAENRIAAKMIIPYPPGIPTILPGEVITEEKIRLIKKYIEMHAKFQGETSRLLNGEIAVYI